MKISARHADTRYLSGLGSRNEIGLRNVIDERLVGDRSEQLISKTNADADERECIGS